MSQRITYFVSRPSLYSACEPSFYWLQTEERASHATVSIDGERITDEQIGSVDIFIPDGTESLIR